MCLCRSSLELAQKLQFEHHRLDLSGQDINTMVNQIPYEAFQNRGV